MSEVGKMYKNANVEKEFAYLECHRGRSSICCPIEEYEKDDECTGCINSSAMKEVYEYPPFTAEKQLELIKLIANRKGYPDYEYFGILFDDCIQLLDFNEALAKLVNSLWQDLTNAERTQIKNILESEVRDDT